MADLNENRIKFYIDGTEFNEWHPIDLSNFIAEKKYPKITLKIEKNSANNLIKLNELLKENNLVVTAFRQLENNIDLSTLINMVFYTYVSISNGTFIAQRNVEQANVIDSGVYYGFKFLDADNNEFTRNISFEKI